MGVDFNKIGLSLSSGRSHSGFGAIVANPTAPTGFPPYGTIIGTGTEPINLSWNYSDNSRSGSFQWGEFPYYVRADGAGGSYLDFTTGWSSAVETVTINQVIDDYEFQPNYRIIYKGGYGVTAPQAGTWSECHRFGATGNTGMGTLYVNINGNDYDAGSYSTVEYYNGFCDTYNEQANYYHPYGTFIYYDSSLNYNYYWDGNGGYYTESASPSYPSYGEFLYGEGGSSDLTWNAPDGSSGSWTYSSWGCSYYADGMGGSYSSCGGYTQSYGTEIRSGSYSYENGTNEWGDPTYSYGSYYIYFDGNSGYYTNTY